MSLFQQTIKSIIRDAPNEKKLEILQSVLDEVGLVKREIEVIEYPYGPDLYLSDLAVGILKKLGVNTGGTLFYHPFLIQIVKSIGELAFYESSIRIKKLTVPLHTLCREVPAEYSTYKIDLYIPKDLSEIIKYQNLKSPEEVSSIINRVLEEKGIDIDQDKVNTWLTEHTVN